MRSLLLLVCFAAAASAQTAASRPVPIKDNSFLVEEAYNQEKGVVQHISTLTTDSFGNGWAYSFTQEWPVGGMRHQLSYTVPVTQVKAGPLTMSGIGDVLVNYRFQAIGTNGEATAFAPRLSVLLPTGTSSKGFGTGGAGLQFNLPFSTEFAGGNFVSHTNLGGTWTPQAKNAAGAEASTTGISAGQSFIWLVHPKLNFMLETIWNGAQRVVGPDTRSWNHETFISPGFRAAFDFASGLQIVPGIAMPIAIGPGDGERSVFLYLSFEHPFSKR